MRKIIPLIILLLLALTIVSAQDERRIRNTTLTENSDINPPANPGVDGNVSYEELKSGLLSRLDKVIQKTTDAQTKILSLPGLSEQTKSVIQQSFDNIILKLNEYKADVEATTNKEELKAVNQEAKAYILENKEIIKSNVVVAAVSIAGNAYNKTMVYLEKVQKMLPVLKLVCPQQASSVSQLEIKVSDLEAELPQLQVAIQTQDKTSIMNEVKVMTNLTKEITVLVKDVKQNCPALQNTTQTQG